MFALTFFLTNLTFANSVVDKITDHHTQRRILANTDIMQNESLIKQESNAITDILTTTQVDIKRHASLEEKWNILRGVLGDRFISRRMESVNTADDLTTYSNPYTAILTTLTPNNLALRNHYRVLELTYDLGDCVGTFDLQSKRFLGITKELIALTGIDSSFYGNLLESVIWEHHLATCDQVTENIFEIIPQFSTKKEGRKLATTILAAVAEIKSHPLRQFAQTNLDITQRRITSKNKHFSEADEKSILESLNPIWGAKNLPYQVSAARYLILRRYQPGWTVGINVLSNIEQFYIAHPDISNKDLPEVRLQDELIDKMKQIESRTQELKTKLKETNAEIESLEKELETKLKKARTETEFSESDAKERLDFLSRQVALLLKRSQYEKDILSTHIEYLTISKEFMKRTSYTERPLAIEFLYTEQWDILESTLPYDEHLKHEIMMVKNIMARNNQKRLHQIIDEFLSVARKLESPKKETAQLKKTAEQLRKYDYLFISSKEALSLEDKIRMAEEIKTQSHTAPIQILEDFLALTEKSQLYNEIKKKLYIWTMHNHFNTNTHSSLLIQKILTSVPDFNKGAQTTAG